MPNVLRFRLQLDIKLNVSLVIRPHLTQPSLVSEEALTVSEEALTVSEEALTVSEEALTVSEEKAADLEKV